MITANDADRDAGCGKPLKLLPQKPGGFHRGLLTVVEVACDQQGIDCFIKAKVDDAFKSSPRGCCNQIRQRRITQRQTAQRRIQMDIGRMNKAKRQSGYTGSGQGPATVARAAGGCQRPKRLTLLRRSEDEPLTRAGAPAWTRYDLCKSMHRPQLAVPDPLAMAWDEVFDKVQIRGGNIALHVLQTCRPQVRHHQPMAQQICAREQRAGNQRSAASILPPSTVITCAVVRSARANMTNASATCRASTSRPSKLPAM